MKPSTLSSLLKSLFFLTFFSFVLAHSTFAQTNTVCTDEDCSPAVFNISLDAPLHGPITPQRTEQYKKAYLELKRLKANYSSRSGWQDKNEEGLLVGKGCLRQYQLESRFAYEYEQNPAFKTFISQQERDVEAFREEGFESSRRAINLSRRMESNCKNELKEVAKANGPALEELPEVYQKLGRALGYFDENNKLLKPFKGDEKKAAKANNTPNPPKNTTKPEPTKPALPDPLAKTLPSPGNMPKSNPKPEGNASSLPDPVTKTLPAVLNEPKLSKKEQINQLKDRVSKLPLGTTMKDKITGIAGDLKNAKPKLGLIGNLLAGALKSKLATFLPGPLGILGKIKAGLGIIKALNIFKPKKPKPELASKIDNLNKKGEELAKKAQDAVDKAQQLEKNLDQLSQKTAELQKEIEQREAKIAEMDQTLADLEKKKAEMAAELEDNPRRQLEEIKPQVEDLSKQSEALAEKAETEKQDKEKLLDQVEEVAKEKEQLETDLQKQENELQNIATETNQLEEEIQATNAEVEAVKAEEAAEESIAELEQQIDQLPSEEKWKDEIKICESDLAKLLGKVKGLEALQDQVKKKVGGLFALPAKLAEKVSNLKVVQNTLKLGKKGIPIGEKALAKLDGLLAKGTALGATLELITGKKSKLQEKLESYDQKLDKIQEGYASKVANLDNLKGELLKLVEEKTGLKGKLGQKIEDVKAMEARVNEFISRYNIFDNKDKCVSLADLEGKVEDLKKEQESAEPEAKQLEQEINDAAQEEQKLETETQAVEQEIDETTEKAEELKAEEAVLKEEFGKDLDLKPVPMEEWAESFEVERPYWDAVFHPDDEVVEGYKGRYFEVRLKDASKSVKLLFNAGDYYMEKSQFRKNYGSTIGAFVSEALNSMKKADRGKVQLFIQGSADITGQNTFSGKLNDQYLFDKISVMPQKPDQERFSNAPVVKDIPVSGFRNTHLPDLRARFLKEMIAVYSKKFDPILLEGNVKKFQNKEERNAVIYLFFPEEMLAEYEK